MEREPLSACEAMIMKVIWDQKGDISVPELIDLIQERYKRDYKRTTVVTFLTRLNGKGFISSHRAGRISYIHAEKSEEEISTTKRLLKQRVRSILMLGKGELSIVLGDGGFSNYISSEALAKRISVYDEAIINEINAHIDEIELKQQEIDKQKSEMLSIKKTPIL